ncbi:digeranylgeranylglycerophospholipid reductase [Natronocalculus amylovorans]|uniref:NAD(P)/FAD-dependent oxidoreductase n=1 Tax=Natronocalculus amylovorans TaxID=2917812 RepID=A0AAE3K6V6_9EURY|nr:digeranylgeranylglycerophospholipid reductase [Natronocalculus amylovorans]MCL9815383.1 NAD(P)/FAD-dependent oxidoreductase [Natronocalculus amylovorans]NUE02103.1 NAD(P)/FAD-dependent oxidoreductase [Halorubraceae archaeon YAN]
MSDRFDVIVAGAGPAGAQCARDIAARGYDVVVLETESEEEFPRQSNKSTAGTFPSMMASFGIPDDVVMQFTDDVVLESPNKHYVQTQPGAVLEFADFKRFLVKDSRENGAEYWFDSRVSRPIMDGDEIAGVRYNGDEEVYADIIIDATGPAAPLAKALGVCNLKRENQAIGIEYEMEGVEIDHPQYADLHDAMMLRLDHELAPGGYSWIFHTGGDTAKVGICYIQNNRHQEYAKAGMTVDDYLEYWLENDPRFKNATKLEGKQHRGSAHIQMPTSLSTDRFMAIGDTVPTIDPLWGEGIHKGMLSGRAAAITVDKCLTSTKPDTSADAMATYDQLWHEQVAPRMRARLTMTELLYLAPNERYDQLMDDLNRIGNGSLSNINSGNKLALRKLIHARDIPLLLGYARERLTKSPRWN